MSSNKCDIVIQIQMDKLFVEMVLNFKKLAPNMTIKINLTLLQFTVVDSLWKGTPFQAKADALEHQYFDIF